MMILDSIIDSSSKMIFNQHDTSQEVISLGTSAALCFYFRPKCGALLPGHCKGDGPSLGLPGEGGMPGRRQGGKHLLGL